MNTLYPFSSTFLPLLEKMEQNPIPLLEKMEKNPNPLLEKTELR